MLKSAVSILQELMMQEKLAPPKYETDGTGQDHCKTFKCTVSAGNKVAEGVGATKKGAKQQAAINILKLFEINITEDYNQLPNICIIPSKSRNSNLPTINYVGKLNEFCSGHRLREPKYDDNLTMRNAQFCITCSFANFKTEGFGLNKKDAKQHAAKEMLSLIKENDLSSLGEFQVCKEEFNENNNEVTQEVLNRYATLIKDLQISKPNNETVEPISLTKRQVDISSWSELTVLLDQLGYTYELNTFQSSPCILCLKIKNGVLMSHGSSKEDALSKLVHNAAVMIEDGYEFDGFH